MNAAELIAKAVATVKSIDEPSDDADAAADIGAQDRPVLGDFGNGLAVTYLVDEGDRLVYVQNRDLSASGSSPAALHQRGMANLAEKASKGLKLVENGAIHGLLMDGHFEASLLLLDDLWDEALAAHAPNGFVVALPARDVLAFCDARSEAGVAQLRELVDRVTAKGDHLVSRDLYRRQRGGWHRLA